MLSRIPVVEVCDATKLIVVMQLMPHLFFSKFKFSYSLKGDAKIHSR
jgi:hypothetical protein